MLDLTSAKILADSVGPHGIRLTTFEVVFPRFILAEVNTHRMLSRNSASSRAIPTEKQIERVLDAPFVPRFNARVKGMGVGEPLTDMEQFDAERAWLYSRDAAVVAARGLLSVDKSRANRLLEPFLWHTAIISATEWANFFALRTHPDAQPEFQHLARLMALAMGNSFPKALDYGEWHLPMAEEIEVRAGEDYPPLAAKVSAGRCARVSYDTHWREEDPQVSKSRWNQLSAKGHWSPGEHPAVCVANDRKRPSRYQGNYIGWMQLRKCYPNEAVFTG
jgi:thymidylate synthase ThyX